MGITVSKTEVSGGSFAMKQGDTFLYSVEDPRGKVLQAGYPDRAKRFDQVGIREEDIGKKHLIYEGVVDELVMKNGKIHYTYTLERMWTTPDRFRNTGEGVMSHAPRKGRNLQEQRMFFNVQSTTNSSRKNPPILLCFVAKPPQFPINDNYNEEMNIHSLIPYQIPLDDPNLGVNGDFNRLSNEKVLQFLNLYAQNAGFTGMFSTPEIIEKSKQYKTMTNETLSREYRTLEQRILRDSIKDTQYKVQYANDTTGMPESDMTTADNFLNTGLQLITGKNKSRSYKGISVDDGANYESIFNKEKEIIREHRKEFVGENQVGLQTVMPNVELQGTYVYQNPRTDIEFVEVKDVYNTDDILKNGAYQMIMSVLSKDSSIDGWTQKREELENGTLMTYTFFLRNIGSNQTAKPPTDKVTYVSGLRQGMRRLDTVGSEDVKVGKSQYYGVQQARLENPERELDMVREHRKEVLGMLRALVENDYQFRGTGGVMDLVEGSGKNVGNRMYLLSLLLLANETALTNAIRERQKIFQGETEMNINEAFTNNVSSNILARNEISRLRTALEQNQHLTQQIEYQNTITTAQMVGAIVSGLSFLAIAFYSGNE